MKIIFESEAEKANFIDELAHSPICPASISLKCHCERHTGSEECCESCWRSAIEKNSATSEAL